MKTIADFKRKAILGSTWSTVYHKDFSHRDEKGNVIFKDKDLGNRVISLVQSTQIAFDTLKTTGETVKSYINFPKAADVQFIDANTIRILEDGKPLLTYTFIE